MKHLHQCLWRALRKPHARPYGGGNIGFVQRPAHDDDWFVVRPLAKRQDGLKCSPPHNQTVKGRHVGIVAVVLSLSFLLHQPVKAPIFAGNVAVQAAWQ